MGQEVERMGQGVAENGRGAHTHTGGGWYALRGCWRSGALQGQGQQGQVGVGRAGPLGTAGWPGDHRAATPHPGPRGALPGVTVGSTLAVVVAVVVGVSVPACTASVRVPTGQAELLPRGRAVRNGAGGKGVGQGQGQVGWVQEGQMVGRGRHREVRGERGVGMGGGGSGFQTSHKHMGPKHTAEH